MNEHTDSIEKRVVLRAPVERVWRAIGDAEQFGTWFGIAFDGPFVAGTRITGRIVPTQVDPEVAQQQKPMEGLTFPCWIEQVEPLRLLAIRWHPYAVDPKADPASQPTTRVTFALAEVADGTQLTITESGFDGIPLEHRAKAFASNEQGWEAQTRLIAKYLAMAAKV